MHEQILLITFKWATLLPWLVAYLYDQTHLFKQQLFENCWPNLQLWPLLAAWEWSTAQASVMEIRILVEALQLSTHRNLTTQPVVAHVQELEIQLRKLHWDTPVDLIVVDIQRGQACRKLHLWQIKFQQVPGQVHNLGCLVQPKYHGCVTFELVPW